MRYYFPAGSSTLAIYVYVGSRDFCMQFATGFKGMEQQSLWRTVNLHTQVKLACQRDIYPVNYNNGFTVYFVNSLQGEFVNIK